MIPCQAIIDPIFSGYWCVTVSGLKSSPHTRVYRLAAKSDSLAVEEGMRRWQAEMVGMG